MTLSAGTLSWAFQLRQKSLEFVSAVTNPTSWNVAPPSHDTSLSTWTAQLRMGVAADFVTEKDCGMERWTSPRSQLVALPPKIAACAVVALGLNVTGSQQRSPADHRLITFPVPLAGKAVLEARVMIWLVPPV